MDKKYTLGQIGKGTLFFFLWFQDVGVAKIYGMYFAGFVTMLIRE
jgi:hypothetical protein